MDSGEHLTIVTLDDHVRETVVAAETVFFAVLTTMDTPLPDQFLLYIHENFMGDDRFRAVFHIILWNKAIVFDLLLGSHRYRFSAGGYRRCTSYFGKSS